MKKTAILIGATGLTGGILLQKLIADDSYEHIKLFSRTKIEGLPSKVSQFIGDILNLNQFKKEFTGHVVFCCIGTTNAKTPNKTLYKKIDYGIPVTAAIISKENNIATFLVISAMGANAKSTVFYNKTKGEMERDVLLQNIKNTFILRPSLIGGNRKEARFLEKTALVLFKFLNPLFIGKLKNYSLINAETIAQAMLNLANTNTKNKEVIITSDAIKKYSN